MWHNMIYLLLPLLFNWSCSPDVPSMFDWRSSLLQQRCQPKQRKNLGRCRPIWEDLDNRPLPSWFDNAKIGMEIYWGLFSVTGFKTDFFWESKDQECIDFMKRSFGPRYQYPDLANQFQAEWFKADDWAQLAEKAKMKFVIVQSKHNDGFTMFPSKWSYNWNSLEVGPHRDLVKELSEALNRKKIKFGISYHFAESHNPMFQDDMASKWKSQNYIHAKMIPELKKLVTDYKPHILFSRAGDWAPDTYWQSKEFLSWLYCESGVKDDVVVNDDLGTGTRCNQGCYHEGGLDQCSEAENEECLVRYDLKIGPWGDNRDMPNSDLYSTKNTIRRIITAASKGAHVLVSVGPTAEGTIRPVIEERLLDIGKWLEINGEAIFETSSWIHQTDDHRSETWYTSAWKKKMTKKEKKWLKSADFTQVFSVSLLAVLLHELMNS